MSQIFLVIQSLNPFENVCLCALMTAINVSVAICQLQICQFRSFGKKVNVSQSYLECSLTISKRSGFAF